MIDYMYAALELWGGIFCLVAALVEHADLTQRDGRLFRIELYGAALAFLFALMNFCAAGEVGDLTALMEVCLIAIVCSFCRMIQLAAGWVDEEVREARQNAPGYDRFGILAVRILAGCGIVLAIVNLFVPIIGSFASDNNFAAGESYSFILIYASALILALEICLVAELEYLPLYRIFSVLLLGGIPLVGIVLEATLNLDSLLGITVPLGVLAMFLLNQVEKGRIAAEHRLQLERQKLELSELQTRLMLSQLQPHFLYNSLASIRYLCRKDPQRAAEAIEQFSAYLRGNLGSLKKGGPVPFKEELEHVRTYLWLEQLRYGEDLQVEYDIEEENFQLPVLSVQPLAENAVLHGLMKKHCGGTLLIRTSRTEDGYEVLVKDDGEGFDPAAFAPDENHVGLKGVRQRLEEQCGGRLEVKSAPEQGCEVRLLIPFEENGKESD